jgi:hypothetical protein
VENLNLAKHADELQANASSVNSKSFFIKEKHTYKQRHAFLLCRKGCDESGGVAFGRIADNEAHRLLTPAPGRIAASACTTEFSCGVSPLGERSWPYNGAGGLHLFPIVTRYPQIRASARER